MFLFLLLHLHDVKSYISVALWSNVSSLPGRKLCTVLILSAAPRQSARDLAHGRQYVRNQTTSKLRNTLTSSSLHDRHLSRCFATLSGDVAAGVRVAEIEQSQASSSTAPDSESQNGHGMSAKDGGAGTDFHKALQDAKFFVTGLPEEACADDVSAFFEVSATVIEAISIWAH